MTVTLIRSKVSYTGRKYYRFGRLLFTRALSEPLPAHNIAMGFALGLGLGLGPTFGFQIIPFLAIAFKFNYSKLGGLLFIFISNPLSIVPIYVFELIVGKALIGRWVDVEIAVFKDALSRSLTDFSFGDLLATGRDTVIVFLVGSFFVSIVLSLLTYFTTKPMIVRWKNRKRKGKWWMRKKSQPKV